MADATVGAGEAFKTGKAVYEGVRDFINKLITGPTGTTFAITGAELGVAVAIASIAKGIYGLLFGEKDLLTLSIRLAIEGEITGTLKAEYGAKATEFYLPGRFSLAEAVKLPAGASLSADALEAYFPRYDRTMGHLGFYSDPTQLEFRVLRVDDWVQQWDPYHSPPSYPFPCCRVEPCGWRTLHLFPAEPNAKFPYCDTFFEHNTLSFFGPYAEKVDATGRAVELKTEAELFGALKSTPAWVEVGGSSVVSPPLLSLGHTGPSYGQRRFSADRGVRVYEILNPQRLGVRYSAMPYPNGFGGIAGDVQPGGLKLHVKLHGAANELPDDWYSILGGDVVEVGLWESPPLLGWIKPGLKCENRPSFGPSSHQWAPLQPAPQKNLVPWRRVERLLPVVYNPYAEIVPMRPAVVDKEPVPLPENQSQKFLYLPKCHAPQFPEGGSCVSGFNWVHDISWKSHVTPAPGDGDFPNKNELSPTDGPGPSIFVKVLDAAARHPLETRYGYAVTQEGGATFKFHVPESGEPAPGVTPTVSGGYTLSVVPRSDLVPMTIDKFHYSWGETVTRGFQEYMMADPFFKNSKAPERMWPYSGLSEVMHDSPLALYTETTGYQQPLRFRPFVEDDPFPLTDVLYFWDVAYFYYGLTRRTIGIDGKVTYPKLRRTERLWSPVTISLTRHVVEGETDRKFMQETHKDHRVKSRMLLDTK